MTDREMHIRAWRELFKGAGLLPATVTNVTPNTAHPTKTK